MILLALAELALSRPGFEASIREIAHHYDVEDLPTFAGFMRTSADRVKAERAPLHGVIAQTDEPPVFEWLANASSQAGDFLKSFAAAALRADQENYPILRSAVHQLRAKFPKYDGGER